MLRTATCENSKIIEPAGTPEEGQNNLIYQAIFPLLFLGEQARLGGSSLFPTLLKINPLINLTQRNFELN